MTTTAAPIRIAYFEPSEVISSGIDSLVRATPGYAIDHTWTTAEFERLALTPEIDCLLIETDDVEDWALDMIRRVRRAGTRVDPFLPVFTVHSPVTEAVLAAHAAAGVDTLFAKPHSAGTIITHLAALEHLPRRFVAHPVYVGPERRQPGRPHRPGFEFQVPNRLILRRRGSLNSDLVQGWIAAWAALLATPPERRPDQPWAADDAV